MARSMISALLSLPVAARPQAVPLLLSLPFDICDGPGMKGRTGRGALELRCVDLAAWPVFPLASLLAKKARYEPA